MFVLLPSALFLVFTWAYVYSMFLHSWPIHWRVWVCFMCLYNAGFVKRCVSIFPFLCLTWLSMLSPELSSPVFTAAVLVSVCVFILVCVLVFLQSKSVSSTDSQPTEERQGPSGGYSSSQGGAEAKRRRCDDKEPLAPHSYVRVCVFPCLYKMS